MHGKGVGAAMDACAMMYWGRCLHPHRPAEQSREQSENHNGD